MTAPEDFAGAVDKLLGPFYRRFEKSMMVSNAVVGCLLLVVAVISRAKDVPLAKTEVLTTFLGLNLSQPEYMTTLIVGASLMCTSACLLALHRWITIKRIKALGGANPDEDGR